MRSVEVMLKFAVEASFDAPAQVEMSGRPERHQIP